MSRQKMAPNPSVAPSGYSILSQLNQPMKKITGTLAASDRGRVTTVRIFWPLALVTQSYEASALRKCSLLRDESGDGAWHQVLVEYPTKIMISIVPERINDMGSSAFRGYLAV
jgi:hypothetical protein